MTNDLLTSRLDNCYGGVIYDTMRKAGYGNCVLPHSIKGIDQKFKVAGPAFTVKGRVVPGIDVDETLLKWTEFLSEVPGGVVVVCQPNDATVSHMGELSAETLQYRGVRGYVVDGGCRDTDFILRLGFPVFCKYLTPRDIVGTWIPDGMQERIQIGDVEINPGDYIFGDIDGVIVIPSGIAEEIIEGAEEKINTEDLVRKAILDGTDPKQAYIKYGAF
jgi:4-hydroxy-4-methyl-2-oxoglutarate aldolase